MEPFKSGGKEFKRSGMGFKQGQRLQATKESHNSSVESHSHDESALGGVVGFEKAERPSKKVEEVKSERQVGNLDDKDSALGEEKIDAGNGEGMVCGNSHSKENHSHQEKNQNEKQNLGTVPKTFVGTEMFDGKAVNVVDGLQHYEELFNDLEVQGLVSLVNDLRASGKRGHFQGQTYVVSKRPMKGRGREMIQLGLPIADAPPEEDNAVGTSKDQKIESIPPLLQDVIERLVGMQIMTSKPDSCIIDFYNEGDHSQPHMFPAWFGRPVCILFLTDCDLTFGKAIVIDHHPGDFRGTLKLSLAPGSLLVMQGKSSDFARHAIPSLQKQRILVTFTKSQPKKSTPSDSQRLPSPSVASSHWGPPPSRSPNNIRHSMPSKHVSAVPVTGVLPAPPTRPQIPPPNGIQPVFVPSPVSPAISYPAPVPMPSGSTGWPAAPPRHPPPRFPVPGTGVFLPPPGSANSLSPQKLPITATEVNLSAETASLSGKENGSGKSSHSASALPEGKSEGKTLGQGRNGSVDGTVSGRAVAKEEEHNESVDNVVASQSAGAV
ncbi:hypothetical protein CIPAW_05G158500 [Carya illinoinensis]|nr:hypothetical protein CIPAW_05G158500 [Carya illinoinensis]KAG6654620.1 hypothetical protein CIPAW_05G158500 [Carya illinoinensis]